jgi:hypothetical protein
MVYMNSDRNHCAGGFFAAGIESTLVQAECNPDTQDRSKTIAGRTVYGMVTMMVCFLDIFIPLRRVTTAVNS